MFNALTVIFLLCVIVGTGIHWWLAGRQIATVRRHRNEVPLAFADKIPLSAHQKAADYTITKVCVGRKWLFFSVAILLCWTLGGGLQLLSDYWTNIIGSSLWVGVAVIISFMLISTLLELPISLYNTFVIEEHFGFNHTQLSTFFADLLKSLVLLLLIGIPFITVVLWLMEHAGALWWLYVWSIWMGFSLFMLWAYPMFIAPWFNEFKPLEDVQLQQRIETLLQRNGFNSQGIFVMDGSKRSRHGNAYFTGLGNNKRIVFFDTLLDNLNADEIEAVLAHEVGHFKCNHVIKRIIWLAFFSLGGLAALGWLMQQAWFYQGLGVTTQTTYMALLLFLIVTPEFTLFFNPLLAWASRKHEFEADHFAAQQASATALIQALVKLYKENANTLTPDRLYSAFYDSHPPAPVRIAQLVAK